MPSMEQYIQNIDRGQSKKEAALNAGYSETTAHCAKDNIETTKRYQELMETHLPDTTLLEKHKKFLNSKNENIGVKALEMAYKLKNKYKENEGGTTINVLNQYLRDRGV